MYVLRLFPLISLASLALVLASAKSFAASPDNPAPVVSIVDSDTFLGSGRWKYEYTLTNLTTCLSAECFSNAPIYDFVLPLPPDTGVTDITAPANWSFDLAYTAKAYIPCFCQLPVVEWHATAYPGDALPVGESLSGFSYVAAFGPMKYPYWVVNVGLERTDGDPAGPASPIAIANLAAVPEPEVYGLMLAGLGLLGVAARQKSKGFHSLRPTSSM
jgi:hypothetical protein